MHPLYAQFSGVYAPGQCGIAARASSSPRPPSCLTRQSEAKHRLLGSLRMTIYFAVCMTRSRVGSLLPAVISSSHTLPWHLDCSGRRPEDRSPEQRLGEGVEKIVIRRRTWQVVPIRAPPFLVRRIICTILQNIDFAALP